MSIIIARHRRTLLGACAVGCLVVLTGCSSSDDAVQAIADEFVSVSGTITNANDVAEPAVAVEAVYTNPGDALNPTTTTDAAGNFSLQILKDDDFYLHASKDTFTTLNSEKDSLSLSITGVDIGMPTLAEAQAIIDLAFGDGTTPLQNVAWLVVDIEDGNGDEVNGETITYPNSAITPTDFVYTECDGTDSGGNVTTGATCPTDREGPMYIAYFNAPGDANVAVGSETKIAPLIMGEVTFLDFEVGNELPVAVNDAFNVQQGVTSNLDVAANDSDADDGLDLASISIIASPVNGSVSPNPDGTVTYIHNGTATLTDAFSYAIRDNSGAISTTATVSLTVFGSVSAGALKYDNDCSRCHAAGTHDTVSESASDLFDDGEKLELDMTSINSMGGDAIISPQELIDLRAFLEDPSTNM